MKTTLKSLPIVALAAVLAGCGSDAEVDAAAAAGGQVLKSSISDDMLPYDKVRSQPPLADPEELGEGEDGSPGAADGAGEPEATPDAE